MKAMLLSFCNLVTMQEAEVPIYKKLSKELDGAEDLPGDIKYSIDSKYSAFINKIRF